MSNVEMTVAPAVHCLIVRWGRRSPQADSSALSYRVLGLDRRPHPPVGPQKHGFCDQHPAADPQLGHVEWIPDRAGPRQDAVRVNKCRTETADFPDFLVVFFVILNPLVLFLVIFLCKFVYHW